MTAKAKNKKFEFVGTLQIVPVSEIEVSTLPLQAERRKYFKPEETRELGNNMLANGQIQPIVLSLNDTGRYEILAGERRFLAAYLVEIPELSAIVHKNLTKEQKENIQVSENLNRVNPTLIDEALTCKYFLDSREGMTTDEIASITGYSQRKVQERIQLSNLAPEVFADINDGALGVKHALEIAKFKTHTQQLEVLNFAFEQSWTSNGYKPNKSKLLSIKTFKEKIQREILLSLKSAKFDTKDERLHPDGLVCTKCSERTGAVGSLFADMHDKKNDRCLNSVCYGEKLRRHFIVTREEESAKQIAAGKLQEGNLIPVILYYAYNTKDWEKKLGIAPIITDRQYSKVYESHLDRCVSWEYAICCEDNIFAHIWQICRDKKCPVHTASRSSSSSVETPEQIEAKNKARKQELFDIKVGEPIREEVIGQASKAFSSTNRFVDNEDWFCEFLAKVWEHLDSNNKSMVRTILKKSDSKMYAKAECFKAFTADEREQFMFIATNANKVEMLYASFKNQKPIKDIAEEFSINYQKLDAGKRLSLCSKKYIPEAQEYFNKTEAGEKLERPVFYKVEKANGGKK